MKYLFTFFILIAVRFTFFSQSQIPNGNFESWTDQYHASGWNSVNIDFPLYIHSAVRTSEVNQGNYAADLTTSSTPLGTIPGLITLGEIDIINYSITGGIPFNDRPTGLSYYFKYAPINNDTSYMLSVLTKWNTITQHTDTIGITAYFSNYSIQDYTKVAVPYIYATEEIPDTLNVIFLSSGYTGQPGSNLKVDDVVCEYGTVVSPTLCLPAVNIGSTQFTSNWLTIPNATSYRIDVSSDPIFSSFIAGYEDLETGSDTFCLVNVSPGLYYYRVRVLYGAEVSINSNMITVPTPTNATDASNIEGFFAQANWEPAFNATGYYIDVAQDPDFVNFVPGYENTLSGNTTSMNLSGLEPLQDYYYRIRTEYDQLTSENSNIITFSTGESSIEYLKQRNYIVLAGKNDIQIELLNSEYPVHIKIIDIMGRIVYETGEAVRRLDISNIQSGTYIVEMIDEKHHQLTEKIIVR
jgi:hypothetical protein